MNVIRAQAKNSNSTRNSPSGPERSLTVIAAIPCFNVEQFIGDTVTKTRTHVDKVIVIDDGSTDNTLEVARAAGAEVIKHRTNKGYGESIKSCFEAAKAADADLLVVLDGDAQHDPSDIPKLLAPILNKEADIVIGSRFLQPNLNDFQSISTHFNQMPRYRKFGIDVITFLYNFGSRMKVSDAVSGFRAYSRRVLDTLSFTESGMSISVEVIIRAREKGLRTAEAPISCVYHSQSSTLNPVGMGLGIAFSVVKLRAAILWHNLIGAESA